MVLKQNGKTGRVADIDSHNPLERSSFHTGEATLSAEQLAEKQALEQTGGSSKQKSKLLLILAAMGPGIVTAMAGNDAGGISTYSTVGAQFGFATLWVIPIMCVLLIVVEMTAAKHGRRHRQGLRRAHPRIASASGSRRWPCSRCSSATFATTFSEFAGIASRHGDVRRIEIHRRARRRDRRVAAHRRRQLQTRGESVPYACRCVFLTYVIAAFLAQPNWENAAHQHRRSPCGVRTKLRFTGHIHDRHHHRALDDVLHPEQRG